MPFSTAFMAEFLDTPFAQPAIVFFCLNSLLHNTGWLLLHRSVVKPVPLMKDRATIELHKKAIKGANYGFIIYATLALLAWWRPMWH